MLSLSPTSPNFGKQGEKGVWISSIRNIFKMSNGKNNPYGSINTDSHLHSAFKVKIKARTIKHMDQSFMDHLL